MMKEEEEERRIKEREGKVKGHTPVIWYRV